jgi:hypothetical protein
MRQDSFFPPRLSKVLLKNLRQGYISDLNVLIYAECTQKARPHLLVMHKQTETFSNTTCRVEFDPNRDGPASLDEAELQLSILLVKVVERLRREQGEVALAG